MESPMCGQYIVVGRSENARGDDNRGLSIDEVYVSFYAKGIKCSALLKTVVPVQSSLK